MTLEVSYSDKSETSIANFGYAHFEPAGSTTEEAEQIWHEQAVEADGQFGTAKPASVQHFWECHIQWPLRYPIEIRLAHVDER